MKNIFYMGQYNTLYGFSELININIKGNTILNMNTLRAYRYAYLVCILILII